MLTSDEVAGLLSVSIKTLEAWRRKKQCLPFVKQGRFVRYFAEDIEKFLGEGRIEPTGQ